jgi:TM2 domain-containing membrane protein YozV
MNRRIQLIVCFLAVHFFVYAQFDCSMDLRLLKYLNDSKKVNESLILSSLMLKEQKCNASIDSVLFYRGWAFYQLQQLDSATGYFLSVRIPDSLYNKARFFAVIISLYKNNPGLSDSIAQTIRLSSHVISDLKNLCLAGISLYQGNINSYREFAKAINADNYLISNEFNELAAASRLYEQKRKSPVKAAMFSAILPGSGKWYLGRKGQAITSFLTVGLLAGIASEFVVKNGWKNFYSLSAVSATAIFYGGNIYGSYYLGKQLNKRADEKIKQDIQYYLHVAVRNVYQ